LALAPDGLCVRCRHEEEDRIAAREAKPAAIRRAGLVALLLIAGSACLGMILYALREPAGAPPTRAIAPAKPSVAASAPSLEALSPATPIAESQTGGASLDAASPLQRAAHAARITLFCRRGALACAPARVWLLDRGFTYRERDVDVDPQARQAWQRVAPDGAIPAFEIDGEGVGGFDPARLEAALDYAGARHLQR
jgi:glutaredoxin